MPRSEAPTLAAARYAKARPPKKPKLSHLRSWIPKPAALGSPPMQSPTPIAPAHFVAPLFGILSLLLGLGCDSPPQGSGASSAASSASAASKSQAPSASSQVAAAPAPPASSAPVAPKPKAPVDCPKTQTVNFSDPVFEKAVRFKLSKATGAISKADLGKVKSLDLSQAASNETLDPCIFPLFVNITGLYLAPGKMDDLSPLKNLSKLESLRASAASVRDLSPLSGLTKLDRLDIGRNPISDLRPLAALENLTELMIDDTEVSDLTPLANLKKLSVLNIKRTRVSDISPLKGLNELKNLYIEGSLVKDTSPLFGRPKLKIIE